MAQRSFAFDLRKKQPDKRTTEQTKNVTHRHQKNGYTQYVSHHGPRVRSCLLSSCATRLFQRALDCFGPSAN